jgi:hypothetical protein
MDVLMALFLFSVGFATIASLHVAALREARQVLSINQAANLARNQMETWTANGWRENIHSGVCLPGGRIQGQEEMFVWTLEVDWEEENVLLRVTCAVEWPEGGECKLFILESYYDAYEVYSAGEEG